MARARTIHRCSECGSVFSRWSGRCGTCGEWNTLVEEVGATTVVVGLPVRLDGRVGTAAAAALAVVDRLRADLGARLGVEVVTADERLSTVEAHRRRVEQLRARDAARRGGRGGRAGTPGRSAGRRPVVDHVAAAVFLQSWLDRSLPDPTLPDPTWHDPT